MLKEEFEAIAKRTVTNEQYKAIEALYMESSLDKYEFVKSIKPMLKTIPEKVKENKILTMACHNSYGDMRTPNGCYYLTILVELIDVDVRTGKTTVRKIPNSFDCRSSYDLTDWCKNLVFAD